MLSHYIICVRFHPNMSRTAYGSRYIRALLKVNPCHRPRNTLSLAMLLQSVVEVREALLYNTLIACHHSFGDMPVRRKTRVQFGRHTG